MDLLTNPVRAYDWAKGLAVDEPLSLQVPPGAEHCHLSSGSGTLLRVTAGRPTPAVEYPEGRRP
jgi:hypothetical protein